MPGNRNGQYNFPKKCPVNLKKSLLKTFTRCPFFNFGTLGKNQITLDLLFLIVRCKIIQTKYYFFFSGWKGFPHIDFVTFGTDSYPKCTFPRKTWKSCTWSQKWNSKGEYLLPLYKDQIQPFFQSTSPLSTLPAKRVFQMH